MEILNSYIKATIFFRRTQLYCRANDCSEKPCAGLCVMFAERGGSAFSAETPEPDKHSKGQAGLQRKACPGAQIIMRKLAYLLTVTLTL
jgi:hypothetical protein